MTEVSNKVRQEAAAMVIEECRQWLTKVVQEEMEKIIEETKHITDSKQRVEQIAAAFNGESLVHAGEGTDSGSQSQPEA